MDEIDEPEFTAEQLEAALRDVGERARQEAFAVGHPIMVLRNHRLVLIYPDGHEEDAGEPLPSVRNSQVSS